MELRNLCKRHFICQIKSVMCVWPRNSGGPGPAREPEAAAAQRQAASAPLAASPGFPAEQADWATFFSFRLTDYRPSLVVCPECTSVPHACPVATGRAGLNTHEAPGTGPSTREALGHTGFGGDHKDS